MRLVVSPTDVGLNRVVGAKERGPQGVSPTDVGLNCKPAGTARRLRKVSPTDVGLNRVDGQALVAYWRRNGH